MLLPRHNDKELRSFRFFLERTAPAFAGVSFTDFWLQDIPQACHADAAIWHAAVSLGAVDESYNIKGGLIPSYITSHHQVQFALQQFSLSVKYLIDPSHQLLGKIDKRTALAASILFTCICSIQGLQNQALIHLRSGLKLLQEIKGDHQQPNSLESPSRSNPGPLSLIAMQAVLSNLNTQAEAFLAGAIDSESPSLIDFDAYSSWRLYRAPSDLPAATAASPEHLMQACRAVESLFNNLAVFLHQPDIYGASVSGDVETVSRKQLPFLRTLKSLALALELFESCNLAIGDKSRRKAIMVLKMYHVVCRLLILPKKIPPGHLDNFDSKLKLVVDLATKVLDDDGETSLASGQHATLSSVSIPKPSMTVLLFMASLSSRSTLTRARAIELMKKYPRREGLWDSLMAAELAKNMLQARGLPTTVEEEEAMAADEDRNKGLYINYMTSLAFEGERRAQITMRTFQQWKNGESGERRVMEW